MRASRLSVGVLGHVGNQNLGDEAIIAAVVQNIRRRHPDAEICAFTRNPDDTRRRHGIPAFPIRHPTPARIDAGPLQGSPALRQRVKTGLQKLPPLFAIAKAARDAARLTVSLPQELSFWSRCYRRLRGIDLLFIAGSGQLNDYWGGPWRYPFDLFAWSVLARAAGVKVAFVSLGAGPLTSRLGRWFVKLALAAASYRSYRDESSRDCIRGLGGAGEDPVVPDLAFSLEIAMGRSAARLAGAGRIVGINPMPLFDETYWPRADRPFYEAYVRTLASFADWLVERGYGVWFFATQLAWDPKVTSDIRKVMKHDGTNAVDRYLAEPHVGSFDDLVGVLSRMDIVVATRFHGTLIALLLNKPVLSIAYQQKSVDLMAQMGQREYAVSVDDLRLELLQDRFLSLEGKGQEAAVEAQRRMPVVRQILATQYDHVLALVGG